jgi:cadmium resistance protein CadD (predicted permease)
MILHLFHLLVALHIAFGAVGLVSFWVPVVGKKGDKAHRKWGTIFARTILVAGCLAIGLSLLTLYAPAATHPHLKLPADFIRGIFGVMMLYLAILTVNLAWYGLQTIKNKRDHMANRRGLNLWLQPILIIAAAVCAIEGVLIGQYLMVGMSIIGFATAGTNLMFMFKRTPAPKDYLKEHVKAIVGAGISVYTAFFAFGAVRIMPELALNPGLWSIPLVIGLSIILYHHRQIHLGRLFGHAAPATGATKL